MNEEKTNKDNNVVRGDGEVIGEDSVRSSGEDGVRSSEAIRGNGKGSSEITGDDKVAGDETVDSESKLYNYKLYSNSSELNFCIIIVLL